MHTSDLLFSTERIRATLAACGLNENDADHMPHGAVYWRADADKEGYIAVTPLHSKARNEVDRYLSVNPREEVDAPLFPSPRKPAQPICRETAYKWLIEAEGLADLPKLVNGGFHPYRRLWGSERRGMADTDVASAGGWRSTQALKQSYQHTDAPSVLRVVEAFG